METPTKTELPRTLTIDEAAEATGLSKKAVRNRVDRGQLNAVLRDGKRHIPTTELVRAGLLISVDGELRQSPEAAQGQQPREAASPTEPAVLELFEQLAEHMEARYRAEAQLDATKQITQYAESTAQGEREARERIADELHEARSRIRELETQLHRRRWFNFKSKAAARS
jgi:DNA-binding transcriptional regulator GbsR (MarR family)